MFPKMFLADRDLLVAGAQRSRRLGLLKAAVFHDGAVLKDPFSAVMNLIRCGVSSRKFSKDEKRPRLLRATRVCVGFVE